jgi:chloramphenicol 3-O-phosphotransferase
MINGLIFLLNGTSSSGKSTVLKELHKIKPEIVQLKVDDFFPAQLKAKARELGWDEQTKVDPWLFLHLYLNQKTGKIYFDTQVRELLFTAVPPFYILAKEKANAGQNVIIDTVFEYESAYKQAFDFFKDSRLITILLYCPLDTLLERVNGRNKAGKPEEFRLAFLSFEQFPALYKVQEKSYEPIIDVVKTATMRTALESAIQQLIDNNIPKEYLPKLQSFKQDFIRQFKLDEEEEIALTPRHQYQFIFNSKLQSPTEIAQEIANIKS